MRRAEGLKMEVAQSIAEGKPANELLQARLRDRTINVWFLPTPLQEPVPNYI